MIRVSITLEPASGAPSREIACLEIANDCTGTEALGNYTYELTVHGRGSSKGELHDFDRSLGALELAERALSDASHYWHYPCTPECCGRVGTTEQAP